MFIVPLVPHSRYSLLLCFLYSVHVFTWFPLFVGSFYLSPDILSVPFVDV